MWVAARARKGKTAGRGTKGTKARYQVPARFEGGQMPLHMRLPKLRGLQEPDPRRVPGRQPGPARPRCTPTAARSRVDDLVAKGAVRKGQPVKVLGNGDLTVALQVTRDTRSPPRAKDKIAAAGGSATEL